MPVRHIVIVVNRVGDKIKCEMTPGRDKWYHEEMAKVDGKCEPEWMDAEDPLFILYTSGSTGQPKGVMHTTGGYLVYGSYTHKIVFDYHDGDIYWCTADLGWVTGHTYILYGPLCNGATSVMFEGVPNYPTYSRFWQVVEKYKVNIFYTAPTAIRAIAKEGDEFVKKCDISSLQTLGTVGEPINPEAWNWYFNLIGRGECPIVDTWWQTETGGILITPLPGAIDIKPGMATMPFFGVQPVLVDDEGKEFKETEASGALCIKVPWPGMMRGVYGDPKRFQETYFEQFPGYYVTGDGCRRDKDGYYQITGRIDDVINVFRSPHGHRRSGKRSGCPQGRRGGRCCRHASRHQRSGHLRLCHFEDRRRENRRFKERIDRSCPYGNRTHRHSRQDSVGGWSAQNPQRQDHEKNFEESRRQ